MTIEPDRKDWTWVLERPCPQCGYDAAAVPPEDVAPRVHEQAVAWVALLGGPVHERPSPTTWSPLEYACHVRDVLRLYDERLVLMLEQDDPLYADWDQDATAVEQRYGEQEPAVVADELAHAAERVADRLAGLRPEQWSRPGRRSDGAAFTVTSFARYFLHDLVHHLHDVQEPGPR